METKTEKELLFRVVDDLGEVKEKLHSIDKTLIEQNYDLKNHMRRTQLAEDQLALIQKEIKPALNVYKIIGTTFKWTWRVIIGVSPLVYLYIRYKYHITE
jgi:hypothetical protein